MRSLTIRRIAAFALGFVAAMAVGAAVAADTLASRAQSYRATLTRVAHSTWGLDAPVPVFAAQIHQESGWDVSATSPVGAAGMAQFMPSTAQWWCQVNHLSAADCQPRNPVWAIRSLVGYDLWLVQRVDGATEFDRLWATLRSYNGGLGHWQNEAKLVRPLNDHISIDGACGRASRALAHCRENLGYPDRILNRLQRVYSGWGRLVVAP